MVSCIVVLIVCIAGILFTCLVYGGIVLLGKLFGGIDKRKKKIWEIGKM